MCIFRYILVHHSCLQPDLHIALNANQDVRLRAENVSQTEAFRAALFRSHFFGISCEGASIRRDLMALSCPGRRL